MTSRRHRFPRPRALPLISAIAIPLLIFLILLTLRFERELNVVEYDLTDIQEEESFPILNEPSEDIELEDEPLPAEEEEIEFKLPNVAESLPAVDDVVVQSVPDVSKVMATPSVVNMDAISSSTNLRGFDNGEGGDFGMRIDVGASGSFIEGALIGRLIDFKRDSAGVNRVDYTDDGYWSDARSLVEGDFSEQALARFYRPPKAMAFTHLLMRRQPAENGPKAFGAEELMQSRGWAAYYKGTIVPEAAGRYRFVGYFDDQLVVRLDHKVVLEANWGGGKKLKPRRITGWAPTDAACCGKWAGFHGIVSPLVPGDWFEVEAGKPLFIELMIGERSGSKVGGLLLIQQAGVEYPKDHVGRPILPIFSTRPLSWQDREYIQALKYKISTDAPLFNAGGFKRALNKIIETDIPIEVDID